MDRNEAILLVKLSNLTPIERQKLMQVADFDIADPSVNHLRTLDAGKTRSLKSASLVTIVS